MTSEYESLPVQTLGVEVKRLSGEGKRVLDIYVAFRFGEKLTILGATNGVARVKSRLKFLVFVSKTKFSEINFQGFTFCLVTLLVTLQGQPSLPPSSPPRLVKIVTGDREFMRVNLCSIYKFVCRQTTC